MTRTGGTTTQTDGMKSAVVATSWHATEWETMLTTVPGLKARTTTIMTTIMTAMTMIMATMMITITTMAMLGSVMVAI
ncbi:MAG: hypothetical protein K0U76_15290 [Actinomycetia bacterium]|nr:hypothetical protein [Actinomycetes bacterium]